MDENNYVAKFVTENENNVAAAMSVIRSIDQIRETLLQKFSQAMDDLFPKKGTDGILAIEYVVSSTADLYKEWSTIFRIRVSGWEKHTVSVASNSTSGGKGLIFGLKK